MSDFVEKVTILVDVILGKREREREKQLRRTATVKLFARLVTLNVTMPAFEGRGKKEYVARKSRRK